MTRQRILEIVAELMEILNEKAISPSDANAVATNFERYVRESNEAAKECLMLHGRFTGSTPDE